ncbi:P-loop NTPase family protein [Sphingosinicella rhizophila]|uniref:AAA family ATPase n=1 Tax=Sphingosinicella rhizophila TaxID=3050082 RepID=A0ABU3Q2X1_9SPHN|nr:AAA family ATPase [Sphingosinicella sp. GR2756]MDT9597759.1 AAA family ATPase [Sphingosinicella sp. GR2756]
MTKHSPLKAESLLERAAEIYDFGAALRRSPDPAPPSEVKADPALQSGIEPAIHEVSTPATTHSTGPVHEPAPRLAVRRPITGGGIVGVDRERLREGGFIVPEAPVGSLAEEFRIVKRQLLASIKAQSHLPEEKKRSILVCSAQTGEGKTFCAINLALSLAAEPDLDVLLVDGDFNKPEIFPTLGLEPGPGLIDAIGSETADVERFVVRTDIEGLSLLPAGRAANNVTELLGSDRTRQVLGDLVRDHPRRLVLFDSPPALMASPASVLAAHVGQLLIVVRADQTTDSDLREALGILSACDTVSLMLNAEAFAAGGRRYGNYYGYGQ